MDNQLVLNNIRRNFKEYVTKAKLASVVLGISGGIDSALVAAIVRPVCKELSIKMIGVSLPSASNKFDEVQRANAIMFNFFDKDYEYDIEELVAPFKAMLNVDCYNTGSISTYKENPPKLTKEQKIEIGNIKARCRMISLYAIAYENNGMVLGTDNLTEFNLGFWTLHGDVGDYSMIQYLWKGEVYELSQWIIDNELKDNTIAAKSLKACIDAVPTDGLGVTSSDLEQIKAKSYDEVDTIFKEYFESGKHKDHPVIQRHERTHFKRNNPCCISRENLFKEE